MASHLAGLPAVASTVAPKALPSWIAVVPMPEVPPCTSSVSPAFSAPWPNTLAHTVKKVSGRAAASIADRAPGTGRTCGSGVAA